MSRSPATHSVSPSDRIVKGLLLALAAWDVLLAWVAIFEPELWYRLFHGASYVDPQGLLKRTGAVWIGFALLQGVAAFRFHRAAYWLPLVAGVRWTELFSDWTYAAVANDLTSRGWVGLLLAPPINLVLGLYLMKVYRRSTALAAVPVPRLSRPASSLAAEVGPR